MRVLLVELFYVLNKNLLFTRCPFIDAALVKSYPPEAPARTWIDRINGW